jgi:dihydrofolate reductase
LVKLHAEKEVFIIGGGEIYNQTIDIANVIYRTLVNTTIDGDVYFSDINSDAFNLVWEEKHEADEKNKFDYTYQKFERIGLL